MSPAFGVFLLLSFALLLYRDLVVLGWLPLF
jgi:hypothetical protein